MSWWRVPAERVALELAAAGWPYLAERVREGASPDALLDDLKSMEGGRFTKSHKIIDWYRYGFDDERKLTRYGVTGSTRIERPVNLEPFFAALTDASEITTGAAPGIDTVAYYAATAATDRALHRVVVPGAPYNPAVLDSAYSHPGSIVVRAPLARTTSDAYMKRNDLIVQHSDVLLAFPDTGREQLRSGTWATVRRARNKGIAILVLPLNGAPPRFEPARSFKPDTDTHKVIARALSQWRTLRGLGAGWGWSDIPRL